jgi:hypothetical protein
MRTSPPTVRGRPDLRFATLVLLAAGACWPLAASGAEGRSRIQVDAELRAELGRLVAQASALGFPDLTGSRLFQGELAIHWRDAGAARERTCAGFHAQLADGSWMVGGLLVLRAHGEVAIDATALKAVDWQQLGHDDSGWLEGGDLLDLEDAGDCREWLPRAGALLAVALSCGVAHLDHLANQVVDDLATADLPWEERPLGILDAEFAPGHWLGVSDWDGGNGDKRARQDPATALRIALALWFRRQLLALPAPFPPLPPAQAQHGALAIIGASALPIAAHLRLLAGRADLAARLAAPAAGPAAPAGPDIADRLAAWRIADALQEDEGRVLNEDLIARYQASDDPDVRRWMPRAEARMAAWSASRFAAGDLAALIAACDRDEVSLRLDQGRPRSIGDQALRAVTSIVEIDARLLAGRDAAAPWTPAERHAVAHGLSAWWSANAGRPLAQLQEAMLPTLPVEAIGHLLVMTERVQRRPLYDRLLAQWAAGPPAGDIEGVLGLAVSDPAMAAMVDAWPVAGAQRIILAAWHTSRGDRAPGLALLDAAIRIPGDDPASLGAMREAVAVCGLDADAATLRRFQLMLAADPLPEAAERLVIASPPYGFSVGDVLWDRMQGGMGASMMFNPGLQILRAALVAQGLADQRTASPRLRALASARYHEDGGGQELAQDLRVCDVAALFAHRILGCYVADAAAEERLSALYWDPARPRAERDATIHGMIAFIRPVLAQGLAQAKLPLAIPGLELKAPGGLGDF